MEILLKISPKAFFCRQAGMAIDCVVWEPALPGIPARVRASDTLSAFAKAVISIEWVPSLLKW